MQHFPSGELCRCSSAVCLPSQHISWPSCALEISSPTLSDRPSSPFVSMGNLAAREHGFPEHSQSAAGKRLRPPSVGRVERYLVDGMNVIGSRPDGWWRDLDGAVVRLARCLAAWRAAEEVEATVVYDGSPPSGLNEIDLGGL